MLVPSGDIQLRDGQYQRLAVTNPEQAHRPRYELGTKSKFVLAPSSKRSTQRRSRFVAKMRDRDETNLVRKVPGRQPPLNMQSMDAFVRVFLSDLQLALPQELLLRDLLARNLIDQFKTPREK